ncbi:hypothetical protein VNO78_02836 [Psophocarpus tetragonolobus]|uniref:Uncharacterized protein n=1 Tax=Psophocarpus tetragonolobus TaxID=3891 RepID=A0AAN9T378_PSOTE
MPVLILVPLLASPYPTGHHISSSTHSDTVRSYGHALVQRAKRLLDIIKKCDSPPISLCAYSPSALKKNQVDNDEVPVRHSYYFIGFQSPQKSALLSSQNSLGSLAHLRV